MRTKGSLAGVNLLMIAVVFPIILFFGTAMTLPQMGVMIAFFVTWQGFAIYAMRQLPSHDVPSELSSTQSPVSKEVKAKRGKTS